MSNIPEPILTALIIRWQFREPLPPLTRAALKAARRELLRRWGAARC